MKVIPIKDEDFLSLYRIPFPGPLGESCHERINLRVTQPTCRDRSLYAGISPEAPAIKNEGGIFCLRQDKLEGKELLLGYEEGPRYSTSRIFYLGPCVNDYHAGATIHHLLQFFGGQVRGALFETARTKEYGNKEKKQLDIADLHACLQKISLILSLASPTCSSESFSPLAVCSGELSMA